MLPTSLNTSDVPDMFDEFAKLVGETHWISPARAARKTIRHNSYLQEYLRGEYEIALVLEHCSDFRMRYGKIPVHLVERSMYSALAFAAQTMSIIHLLGGKTRGQFIRRVQGAFANPNDMRALRLELVAATHFSKRNIKLEWPELDGTGTCDLRAPTLGHVGLQIECKSISNDKGRKIHRREALEFFHLMSMPLSVLPSQLTIGISVVVTLPGRLPAAFKDRRSIANKIVTAVLTRKGISLSDGTFINVSAFEPTSIRTFSREGKTHIPLEDIERVTSTRNREAIIFGGAGTGIIILVIQSQQEDSVLEKVFSTLSESLKKQFLPEIPILFLVGFEAIDDEPLRRIAEQDYDASKNPTALRIRASEFLSSHDRQDVIGAAFLSRGALRPIEDGVVESGGLAYTFPNPQSRLWHEDFRGLFSAHWIENS